MSRLRFLFVLIGLTLLSAMLVRGQSGSPILFDTAEQGWGCGIVGIGMVSSLNPFNARQVESLYEHAQTDLRSAHLTSLLSESYGYQGQALRTNNEFAIYDDAFDQVVITDSLVIQRITLIRMQRSDGLSEGEVPNCGDFMRVVDAAGPVLHNRYWVVSGTARFTRNAAFTSYQNARKNALTKLGDYLGVQIQSMERRLNSGYASITYQRSGTIFENILLGRLLLTEHEVQVVLLIGENAISQIP